MHKQSMKSKALSGMFWSMVDLLSKQGIHFVIQIFLARLLLPKDFGIIGMVTIFIALSQTLIDSGFSSALIREKEASEEDFATVFYFNLGVSIVLYVILFFSAGAISRFFEEPQLFKLLRVLGIIVIINAFGLIQRTMLIRKIDFKSIARINVVATIISGTVAILCAMNGLGVWSLVIKNLLMQLIQAVYLSLTNRWKPIVMFNKDSFKKLFSFSWKLLASSLIYTVYNNLYYLVIGKYFSVVQLGYYTNAEKLRSTASESMTQSIHRVTYPVLSDINIHGDDEKLKDAYKKVIKTTVFVMFPIMLGLVGVAQPMILLLFGSKWAPSIVFFQILCVSGMIFPLHSINLNILQVKGRSDLFLKLEIIKMGIGIGIVAFVLFFKLGLIELMIGTMVSSILSYYINSYYSGDLLSYALKEQIKDMFPALFTATTMCGLVLLIGYVLKGQGVVVLLTQIISGVIIYTSLSWILKIDELRSVIVMAKSILHKKQV